jgi:starch synthase
MRGSVDPVDFARQIARLIAEPELRQTLGCSGRQRIEAEFGWPDQKRRLLQVYSLLLPRPHRR